MPGYHYKILRVDLTARRLEVQDLDPKVTEKYVGGAGVAAKFLCEETKADTDPLGPDNRLLAFTGPYTGTSVPSSTRISGTSIYSAKPPGRRSLTSVH